MDLTNWLSLDPSTWPVRIAGYEQNCPDDCGQRILVGQTAITNVSGGGWRRVDCAVKQWENLNNTKSGTQADFLSAIKRAEEDQRIRIINMSWAYERPRNARFHWTEVKQWNE